MWFLGYNVYYNQLDIGDLCNGSTTDSDSVCWGSNPYSAAKNHRTPCAPDDFLCIWKRDSNKEGSKMKKACYAFFIAAKPPKARSVRSGACRRAWDDYATVEDAEKRQRRRNPYFAIYRFFLAFYINLKIILTKSAQNDNIILQCFIVWYLIFADI